MLKPSFKKPTHLIAEDSILRIKCEQYVHASSIEKKSILKEIDNHLNQFKEKSNLKSGPILPHKDLQNNFIKEIHLQNDSALTKLFAKYYLPVPKSYHFEVSELPKHIVDQEKETTQVISQFFNKNMEKDYFSIEKIIKLIQRTYRAKKRQKEEHFRIEEIYGSHIQNKLMDSDNFGAPYNPKKCSPNLAERIVKTASQINLLKNIRHVTSKKYLINIFNDCLYGRKTMQAFLTPFVPSALKQIDIDNGDANMICFGSDYGIIDPSARGEIELGLELAKLDFIKNKSAHCALFKQQDLGFACEKLRSIDIRHDRIHFKHTASTLQKLRFAEDFAYMHFRYEQTFCLSLYDRYREYYSGIPHVQINLL